MKMLIGLLLSIFSYGSPINYEMILAGNFGEPRPNHFHGGVDIKTEQVEGKLIHAIGDGFISRVTVDLDGFGNAIYVEHPEGYTSVYAHLKSFTPQIEALVKKWQYEHRSNVTDVRFRAYELPVAQGQLIALSGNTGASQAPHLHLEIHDTRTWNMLDPLEFLGDYVNDNTPPVAHAFMAYPQPGEGVFNGNIQNRSFQFSGNARKDTLTAWGKVGFSIRADDYMPGSNGNKYGIRSTRLLIDGNEIFHSDVHDIPVTHNRLVNIWGDYEHYRKTKVWFMKSFKEPANLLPVITTSADRGIFDFNEERDYRVQYILSDYFGNTSEYTFVVRGKKSEFVSSKPEVQKKRYQILHRNRKSIFRTNGAILSIDKGLLTNDIELSTRITSQAKYSNLYVFSETALPLFGDGKLSLRLQRNVPDTKKLYIVCHSTADYYMGGEYKDGWVTGRIRDLTCVHEIMYDDAPPAITCNFSSNSSVITARVEDGKSGVAAFEGYLDGQFVLFKKLPRSATYVCDLKKTPVRPNGKLRNLRLKARDYRANEKNMVIQVKY